MPQKEPAPLGSRRRGRRRNGREEPVRLAVRFMLNASAHHCLERFEGRSWVGSGGPTSTGIRIRSTPDLRSLLNASTRQQVSGQPIAQDSTTPRGLHQRWPGTGIRSTASPTTDAQQFPAYGLTDTSPSRRTRSATCCAIVACNHVQRLDDAAWRLSVRVGRTALAVSISKLRRLCNRARSEDAH